MIDVHHDPGEGVAYVALTSEWNRTSVRQEMFGGNYGTVILDFDANDFVIGVEVIA